jgi:glycosyltransferase involved in cell wall biosynthesis
LLKELVDYPAIESIHLALSEPCMQGLKVDLFKDPKIQEYYLTFNDQESDDTLRRLENLCNICFNFWPHVFKFIKVNLPTIILVQDLTFVEFPELFDSGVAMQNGKDVFVQYLDDAKIICISSKTTGEKINKLIGPQYQGKLQIIRHALFERFSFDPDLKLEKYDELLNKDYFICMSNTSPHKNLSIVLESYAQRKNPDFNLVFIGPGTEVLRKDWDLRTARNWVDLTLNGLANRLGLKLGRNVFGYGLVSNEDKYFLLQHAKGLIMPSLGEGGGSYPIEESLYLKIPVITSDIPIIKEAMSYHQAQVLYFNPYSVDSLNKAIDELYANYQQCVAKVSNDKVLDELTWEKIGRSYFTIFKENMELNKVVVIEPVVEPEEEVLEVVPVNHSLSFRIRDFIDKVLKLVKFLAPYGVIKGYLKWRHKE